MDVSYIFIFCLAPIFVLNFFMQKQLREFSKLYKERIDQDSSLSPDQINNKYAHKKLGFIKDIPKISWLGYGILWKDYHDKEINKYAGKARLYSLAIILVLILNFIVFTYFTNH